MLSLIIRVLMVSALSPDEIIEMWGNGLMWAGTVSAAEKVLGG